MWWIPLLFTAIAAESDRSPPTQPLPPRPPQRRGILAAYAASFTCRTMTRSDVRALSTLLRAHGAEPMADELEEIADRMNPEELTQYCDIEVVKFFRALDDLDR